LNKIYDIKGKNGDEQINKKNKKSLFIVDDDKVLRTRAQTLNAEKR